MSDPSNEPETSSDSDPASAPDAGAGGLKSPTADPEPLAGSESKVKNPVRKLKEVVKSSPRESTLVDSTEAIAKLPAPSAEGHGSQAIIDAAVEVGVEAEDARPQDQPSSAEAVDQGNVVAADDVVAAETAAAIHAEKLGDVEEDTSTDAVAVGITAAGNKEGDHAENVRKAAVAAEDAPANVTRARADAALDDVDQLDSPHGRPAEANDPWAGERWAPHGDLNVPAVSFGPEGSGAIYGPLNPTAHAAARGIEGDDDAAVERVRKATKGAEDIAKTREQENRKARKIGKATVASPDGPAPAPAREDSYLYSDIYGK